MKVRTFSALVVFTVAPLLPARHPNSRRRHVGHVHLAVKDVEAQKHFWTDIMGGTLVKNGPLELIEFPGVYIMLRQGIRTGPPAGSIVDHFGFVVRDMPAAIAKWKANGPDGGTNGYESESKLCHRSDGIRLEVFGGSQTFRTRSDESHPFLSSKQDIPAMQAWYAKTFGGVIGKRESVARPGNWMDCDDLPGVNLSMSPSDSRRAPTKGRSLDHIGFEVKNLEAFVKRTWKAEGIEIGIRCPAPSAEQQDQNRIPDSIFQGHLHRADQGLAPAHGNESSSSR